MTRHNEKGLLRDRRGAVAALMALMLVMLLGMGALTIDMGFLWVLKNRLQATADAAALAGASQLPNEAVVTAVPSCEAGVDAPSTVQAAALDYACKNMPSAAHGMVLVADDVVLGNWDVDTRTFTAAGAPINALQVTTRRSTANGNEVPLFFAGVLGINGADVVAEATAMFDRERWDVVIVQDVTSSFRDELDEAREADQALLDCVNNEASGESLFGLVVFTGLATVLEPLQPMDSGYDNLSAAISSIDSCGRGAMPECSGTHIGSGMDEAINQYNNSPAGPEINRAMIIVSDGKPNANKNPDPGLSNEDLENLAIASADTAWADGTHVFVVFYDGDNDDVAADFLASLVRGEGIFLRTPDPADLPGLLLQVCAQGMAPPLRLVI